jgi:two-component system, response regulator YesN
MTRVIIVEDEYSAREGMVKLIDNLDSEFTVIAKAENGSDGIRYIRDLHPDIVITDIKMPHMDGLQMIETMRKIGIDCKIVVLSGFADFKFAQRGIQLGISDYILKPITISKVRETLCKLIQKNIDSSGCSNNIEQPTLYSRVVVDMIHTIDLSYGQRLGLDIFTEKYKLTPEYISTLFTKETGRTFSQYLKNVRIQHAKDLILHSNLKIYEIACQVGYPDQKYFSKVFKECTGMSASQFVIESSCCKE